MARSEVLEAPPGRPRRAAPLHAIKERLLRIVVRTPGTVRTKLLVAFLASAALLGFVAVLGVRILAQANARVERVETIQLRSAAYESLEAYAADLQQTINVRSAGDPALTRLTGGKTLQGGEAWTLADLAVADTLTQIELATTEALFRFVPAAADEKELQQIRSDYRAIVKALAHIQRLDRTGVAGFGAQ